MDRVAARQSPDGSRPGDLRPARPWLAAPLGVLLVAGLGCGAIAKVEPWPPAQPAPTANEPPPSTPPALVTSAVAEDGPSFTAYYYTLDDSSQQVSLYKIYRVSPDLDEADVLLSSFAIPGARHRVVTDSWEAGTILFVANGEGQSSIFALDVPSGAARPQELVSISFEGGNGEHVNDARLIDGGGSLAYVTAEGLMGSDENSVLHVVSLADREEKERYPLSVASPLFSGFRFLATTPDGATIYLDEAGGDGPMVWSTWYRVDRRSQSAQPLEDLPPMAAGGYRPVRYAFSPDRSRLAYADFSAVVDEDDLELEGLVEEAGLVGCLRSDRALLDKYEAEGGTISIRDMETGSTSEVFRNLSRSNNYCKLIARRIISLEWLDHSRLAFETIDGVFVLDVDTKEMETLFTFEGTWAPGQQQRPSLRSIQWPFLLFSDHSLIRADTGKRLEFISPEAQEASFFTFDS